MARSSRNSMQAQLDQDRAKSEADAAAAAASKEADRVNGLNALGAQGDRMASGMYFDDIGNGNRMSKAGDTKVRRQSLLGGMG